MSGSGGLATSGYGGGGGSSDYFDRVTGTNDYERQSWRDSYNDGRAAGDLTGSINARLDAERGAFQGATWSGSSRQPSALEFARMGGARSGLALVDGRTVRAGSDTTGQGSSKSSGPGNQVAVSGPVKPGRPAGGSGAGSRLVVSGAPLKASIKDTAVGGYAGVQVLPNPWFSDVQEWWEPRAGEPGEWLGGIVNIGADTVFNTGRLIDQLSGTRIVSPREERGWLQDAQSRPGVYSSFGEAVADFDRKWASFAEDHFGTPANGPISFSVPGRVGGGF
ncbi:MAG TPA: hypothetical protein VL147_10595 [Devosia sp.]|nr:hypothetical protein [Devosia sp.]